MNVKYEILGRFVLTKKLKEITVKREIKDRLNLLPTFSLPIQKTDQEIEIINSIGKNIFQTW